MPFGWLSSGVWYCWPRTIFRFFTVFQYANSQGLSYLFAVRLTSPEDSGLEFWRSGWLRVTQLDLTQRAQQTWILFVLQVLKRFRLEVFCFICTLLVLFQSRTVVASAVTQTLFLLYHSTVEVCIVSMWSIHVNSAVDNCQSRFFDFAIGKIYGIRVTLQHFRHHSI